MDSVIIIIHNPKAIGVVLINIDKIMALVNINKNKYIYKIRS